MLAIATIVADIRKAPFSLNYWSALYPTGVYALHAGQLAMDFDSPAFRTVNTIFVVLLLLGWLYCVIRTIPGIVSGQLFLEEAEPVDSLEQNLSSDHEA